MYPHNCVEILWRDNTTKIPIYLLGIGMRQSTPNTVIDDRLPCYWYKLL